MLLSEISRYIKCKKIYNLEKKLIKFNGLYSNSNDIKKSSLLVIDSNKKFKKKYIDESIKKGAVGLLSKSYDKTYKIPQFIVTDVNKSKKILLEKIFNTKPKNILGITGTNGKTSCVWYISQISLLNKLLVKSYGTLGYFINLKKIEDSILTTPNYEVLHQKAFLNKKKNFYNFVFEVSSHSIKQNRINNFPINIAAITNITHDHLDYHKTFKEYKETKYKLFTTLLKKNGTAIINDNIKGINSLKKILKKNINIISYGTKNSDVKIVNKKKITEFHIFKKKYSTKIINFEEFELENLECAISCCLCLRISAANIVKIINKIIKPKGRLEIVGKLKNNSVVYVDYAHSPEALKKVLIAKTILNKKPNVVFGCGGNRDTTKRSKMGKIANKYANKIFVTDDNPRFEDPKKIRQAVLKYCKKGIEIANRKKAIETAIRQLEANEVLIIAGKGHEKKQITKNKSKIFDDVKIAKNFLKKND